MIFLKISLTSVHADVRNCDTEFISTSLIGVQSEQELKNNINKDNFIPLSRNKLKKIKLINKKNFFLNRLSPNRIT